MMDLHLLRNRNFAVSNVLMLALGAALYGSTVLIPLFMQVAMGYTAEKAGEVLSPGGFAIILFMPLVGFLVSRVDPRYLVAAGFAACGLALIHMTNLNLGMDYRNAMLWRIYQAVGIAFLFVPINTMSFAGVPPEANNQVSGMINLMRNVGGSIGISAAATLIARRTQVHQVYLARNLSATNPVLQQALTNMTPRLGTRAQAYGRIYASLERQAAVLAYIDTFWVMGTICLLAIGLLFLAKKIKRGTAATGH